MSVMAEILGYLFSRLATRTFWYFVGVTFVGVLMMAARSNFKNDMFQQLIGGFRPRY